ncbi:hypothetical protein An17g01220 [Aspergillus niger]|uniref:Uncharacterized protein n=2 Tax=Aspergillus niger TaxID=5061 RepID=A2R9F9_ASPNC|nr:hypothetical protein An17g01220 [Aspergillus niger]CAK43018.1 hypothetical protein An17g01220 [Aspergillus niger]
MGKEAVVGRYGYCCAPIIRGDYYLLLRLEPRFRELAVPFPNPRVGQPDNPGKPTPLNQSINQQQRQLLLHKTCVIHVDPVYRAGFPSTRPSSVTGFAGLNGREGDYVSDRQTDSWANF